MKIIQYSKPILKIRKKQEMLARQFSIICLLISAVIGFQFKSPYLLATPTTINTLAQYTIFLQRQFAQNVSNTPWNTIAVPAGSDLQVIFPSEYTLTGSQTCDTVIYGVSIITGYTCTANPSTKTITIGNTLPTSSYLSDITVIISNVMNPFPAITTSPFKVVIGDDYTAMDPFSAISLISDVFNSIQVNFNPSIVNTTGNMIVNFVNTNRLPIGAVISVKLPSVWNNDALGNYRIPVNTAMTCTSLSTPILSSSISCTGNPSTQTITLSSLSTSQIPPLQSLSFSISNLFPPPTQNPNDTIILTSALEIAGNLYQIDTSSSVITGLVAKSLNDLAITPASTIKTINTMIGLKITFTLQDTITKDDYFQVSFPPGTSITPTTSSSSLSLVTNNFTFNSNTSILTFYHSPLSPSRFQGFAVYIIFLTYRTPNSTKPTDPITFRIMKSGQAKMRGSTTFTADPKNYSFTASTTSNSPNSLPIYKLSLSLSDALDRTGYFVITLPSQLTVPSNFSCSIQSSSTTSINSSPTVTKINSTTYHITNLNRTSTSLIIPTQTINITLNGIQNPNSVRTLDAFGLVVVFSSEGWVNAYGIQTNTLTIVGGLVTGTVSCDTSVTAELGQLLLNFTTQNAIPINGKILITIPPQIAMPSTPNPTLITLPSSTTIPITSSVSLPILTLTTSSLIPAVSSLQIIINQILSPSSTAPSSSFSIQTVNQNGLTIDIMNDTTLKLTMLQLRQFSLVDVSRDNVVNYGFGIVKVRLEMRQGLGSGLNNVVNVQFPTELGTTSFNKVQLIQSDNTTTNLSFTLLAQSPLKLSISLPSTLATPNTTTLTFSSLQNPISLKPTGSGIKLSIGYNITTTSPSTTYLYCRSQSPTLQNTQVADFITLDYAFSTGVLFAQASLVVYVGVGAGVGLFGVQLDNGLGLKGGVIAGCSGGAVAVTCSLVSSSPYLINIAPSSSTTFPAANLTLTINIILTPTIYSLTYSASTLTSYDNSNYVISRSSSKISFIPSCSLPCRQCQTNQPTRCLSCYLPSQNITSLPYFALLPSQTYGQCYSTCPSGYSLNTSSSNSCFKCDSSCLECSIVSTNCTSCSGLLFLYSVNSTCLSLCPSGYYGGAVSGSNICIVCSVGCQICSSGTSCSKCISGYYLYNNVCSTSCPPNITIANSTARTCDSCSSSCLTCSTSTTSCTSCPSGLVLSNNSCHSYCPSISMIPINGTCTACASPCFTCSISTTNCSSCNLSSTNKYFSSLTNTCLSSCPSTYYSNLALNFICSSCNGLLINCLNCSTDGTLCLSCNNGFVFLNGTCLASVPNGYINISGDAVPCNASCTTCLGTVNTCTSCPTSTYLYSGQCLSSCPNTTSPSSSICVACTAPCVTCSLSPTTCTSCQPSYFLSTSSRSCVNSSSCEQYTYPNSTTSTCSSCISPCLSCTSSASCSSCVRGFYFQSIGRVCIDVCPLGWVGVVDVCLRCSSPCRYCVEGADNCTACISGYFLNTYTHQCLLQCPINLTISNPITMTCDLCIPPCQTCQTFTTTCLSCTTPYFLYSSQCFLACPLGYYKNTLNHTCTLCSSPCSTCSSSTSCTSCTLPLHLYNSTCIQNCPLTHSIIGTDGRCVKCGDSIVGCITCTTNGCLNCQTSYKIWNAACYVGCPDGYVDDGLGGCITVNNSAKSQLATTLSSSAVFPMPFTCIGVCLFIACIMSKLQNKNTYLIGAAYCLSGLLQTSSLIYLLIKYITYNRSLQSGLLSSQVPTISQFPLLSIALIIIYILNFLGLIIQTPILCSDEKFQNWLKNSFHKTIFSIVTVCSFLINYKIKLFVFIKLFSFTCTRAQLENVGKFRLFNVLSFIGVAHQIFVIYMSAVMITKLPTTILNNQLFLVFIDTLTITVIAIILSVASNKKQQDFFAEQADNGYILNKKIMVEGDDLGQQGLEPKYLKGDQNKLKQRQKAKGMESFQNILDNGAEEIFEDQQLSLSISQNRSQIERREKNNRKRDREKSQMSDNDGVSEKGKNGMKALKKKNDLHFMNEQTSNPMKKQIGQHQKEDLNESGKHSVIFERQKYFDQAEIMSKNQTVLIQSPSKSSKKQVEGQKLTKNEQERAVQMNNKNINDAQGQEQLKKERLRKQNQTKIYYENKELLKNSDEDRQIQQKIKMKLNELQGLKRQNSHKELRKSREKDSAKPQDAEKQQEAGKIYSAKNNQGKLETGKIYNKANNTLSNNDKQTNLKTLNSDKQISAHLDPQQQSNKKLSNIFDQQPEELIEHSQHNSLKIGPNNNKEEEGIPEVSALIRQQAQLKNNYLPEEKQHASIGEEIQLSNSLAISKLESQNKLAGKLEKNGAKMKSEIDDIQEQFVQQKSSSQQSSKSKNVGKRLQTNKQQKIEQQHINMSKKSWFPQSQNSKPETKIEQKLQSSNTPQHIKSPSMKKQKKNIQNMFDSIVLNQENEDIQKSQTKKQQIQIQIQQQIQQNKSNQNKNSKGSPKKNKGVDIGIGEQISNNDGISNKYNQETKRNNIFQYEQDEQSMEDSGLEDSRPGEDQQINHRPMKSSFATDQKSQDGSSVKHPLVGILQAGQQGLAKNKISKMADEDQHTLHREDEIKTKMAKYANDGRTQRRAQQRPPIQRPSSTEKNRIYAAGLRHLQDQTITKKHSYENPLHEKQKILRSYDNQGGELEDEISNRKRNSLYNVPLQKHTSREVSSSDHTQDILIRPGYFNNSSSQDVSFTNQKFTSTMNVDSGNEIPEKPTIGVTSRTSFNNRVSTSQERGGRMKRQNVDQNVTAGQRMFSKKSVEYQQEEEDDDLNQFYGKIKENKSNKSPKRSRSKQRNPSKQSVKRMKQIEKVYLQRLQMPKKKQ